MPFPSSAASAQLRAVADRAAERIRDALPSQSRARLAAIRLQAQQQWWVTRVLRASFDSRTDRPTEGS